MTRAARPRTTMTWAVTLALIVAACSGSDDAIEVDTSTPASDAPAAEPAEADPGDVVVETPPATPGALLASVTTSPDAEELDRVRFDGIDPGADLSELELVLYAGGLGPLPLTVYADDDGLYTSIGVHPVTPGQGGLVELQFVAGDERSEPLAIELTPLPPSPGAFDLAVETIVAELAARAAAAGTDLDELAATEPDQLDPDLRILKLVAGYVDDGTEHDLESLLVAPDSDLTEDGIAMVDAIIGKLGPLALVPGGLTVGPAGFAGASVRSAAPAAALSTHAFPTQASGCMAFPLEIGTSDQLAAAMETGRSALRTNGGAVDKLVQDVNALAGKTGLIPGVGNFVGAVQTMYATMDLWFNADAGRYPTFFSAIQVQLSIDEFNEDFTQPGTVSSVSLTAGSTGFDASKEFSQIASSAANAAAGAIAGKAKEGVGKLDGIDEAGITAGEKLRDSASSKIIDRLSKEYLQWCPDSWTVSDADDSNWVEISPVIGRISVDRIPLNYQPVDLGDDFLRVRARGDKFSGASISTNVPVTTKQLQVVATPDTVRVKRAGDTVSITTELRNADTTTLFWDPGAGRWDDGTGEATNEPRTRPLVTPTAKDAYPFLVTVESLSTTGLRANATDVRVDTVTVELEDLIVEPDPGRVRVRKQLTFSATDQDGNTVDVRWTATGGSIDEDGVYTAGNRPGRYEVTATAADDPSRTTTVTVEVFEADCVEGLWLLRSQEFLAQLAAATGQGATAVFRSGEYRIELRDDGGYTGYRDQWSFDITIPEGTITVQIDSTDPGEWSVDAEQENITVVDYGSEAEVSFSINGMPLPTGGMQSVGTEAFSGTVPYTCDGDVLVAAFEGITSTFDRIG